MKINLLALLTLSAILIIFALAHGKQSGNLLIITPINGTAATSLSALDEINENKFMLTYIYSSRSTVKAFSGHDAVIIGTNYSFPFVYGYNIEYGGFFTYDMQKNNRKAAVLNKKAAFDFFGGNNIVGNEITLYGLKYVVFGIIDDKGEEANVYVNAALMDANNIELICPLDESFGISAEYVKNELKFLGITDDNFIFTDNELISRNIGNIVIAAFQILLVCLTILFIKRAAGRLTLAAAAAKEEMEHMYWDEFLKLNRRLCATATVYVLLTAAGLALLIYLSSRLLDKALLLSDTFDICRENNYFIILLILAGVYFVLSVIITARSFINTCDKAD